MATTKPPKQAPQRPAPEAKAPVKSPPSQSASKPVITDYASL